jgi:hypothetical protein
MSTKKDSEFQTPNLFAMEYSKMAEWVRKGTTNFRHPFCLQWNNYKKMAEWVQKGTSNFKHPICLQWNNYNKMAESAQKRTPNFRHPICSQWNNYNKMAEWVQKGTPNFRHPICLQWNIAKWRNEYKKGPQISDTHFVCNGIIITKWWSNLKAGTTKFWQPFCSQSNNLSIYSSVSHIFSLYTIQAATQTTKLLNCSTQKSKQIRNVYPQSTTQCRIYYYRTFKTKPMFTIFKWWISLIELLNTKVKIVIHRSTWFTFVIKLLILTINWQPNWLSTCQ